MKYILYLIILIIPIISYFEITYAKKIDINLYQQKYSLSCEAAALKVILNYYGIKVNEDDIIKKMTFDKTKKINNKWGNPYIGFVGNIDGIRNTKQITGFGVFNTVIKNTAKKFGINLSIYEGNIKSTDLKKILDQNKPIIAWIGMDKHITKGPAKDFITWKTKYNKIFSLPLYEHTIILYGYELGDLNTPTDFYVLDVFDGITYKIPWYKLRPMMAQMNNMIAY